MPGSAACPEDTEHDTSCLRVTYTPGRGKTVGELIPRAHSPVLLNFRDRSARGPAPNPPFCGSSTDVLLEK